MRIIDAVKLCESELCMLENPTLEAEWLVALSLGIKRADVYKTDEIDKKFEKRLFKDLKKRKKGMPLEYVVSSANFYGYDLYVDKNVLVPRPETEELVLLAKDYIERGQDVLDIGTGSGAIAIAIKKQTDANVFAVDKSRSALKIAKKNAKNNHADIDFAFSDLFSGVRGRKFDAIIANPPYISRKEYEKLDKTVKNYEPKLALVGGEDGLKLYKRIIKDAPKFLKENGKIFFEIGFDQAEAVSKMLEKDFENIKVKKDLEGNDRMVFATKRRELC